MLIEVKGNLLEFKILCDDVRMMLLKIKKRY